MPSQTLPQAISIVNTFGVCENTSIRGTYGKNTLK